ncbi:amidase family protein [Leucobacter sp. L43]|uniref:amidase family protein n=1 Tax=Leucobacter sp. L43 TaxID=2798040 RepID=UPI0019054B1D|nr:amidase family protein [Leucobacter sp. L43]
MSTIADAGDGLTRSTGEDGVLVLHALERARHDPFRSFIAVAESAPRSSHPRAAFAGVPFAAKDNLEARGFPTTANTPALLGTSGTAESPVVAALRAVGAVLIGKTGMHELALGVTSSAAAFPATVNPRDSRRSAGGSSGGSGAAVAAGIVPFALGTDTGGSITIPAAWCGVYGFRPSTGRWSAQGTVPLSSTRDTVGVIAESVQWIAEVDRVVAPRYQGHRSGRPPKRSRMRIGIPDEDSEWVTHCDAEVARAWMEALLILAQVPDIELVPVVDPGLHRAERSCGTTIELYEISHELTRYLGRLPEPIPFGELRDRVARAEVRDLLDESLGHRNDQHGYAAALRLRSALQRMHTEFHTAYALDALLYPSVPMVASLLEAPRPRAEAAMGERAPGDAGVFVRATRNVNPGSVAGAPALTVPAPRYSEGLPVGLTLEGARFADRRLIEVAGRVARRLHEHADQLK